jgi:hypothetical protein
MSAARHLIEQRAMLRSLGNVAADSLLDRLRSSPHGAPEAPGPWLSTRVAAPSSGLITDFLRHVGAKPTDYADIVPPPLFPQWGLSAALGSLRGHGFPLIKMLNGGCRLHSNAALRRGEPLLVRARLQSVEQDERRTVLCQRVITEQAGTPEALVADVYGIIRAPGAARSEKAHELVPGWAKKLEDWSLGREVGLEFALLTGDFNPLHWLRPYARAFGFRSTILHGFAAMARAYVGLERAFGPARLGLLDVRFVKPLLLPASTALTTDGSRVFVGNVGEAPHLTGTLEIRS